MVTEAGEIETLVWVTSPREGRGAGGRLLGTPWTQRGARRALCWEVNRGTEAYEASPLDLNNVLDSDTPFHPVEKGPRTLVGRRASSVPSSPIGEHQASARGHHKLPLDLETPRSWPVASRAAVRNTLPLPTTNSTRWTRRQVDMLHVRAGGTSSFRPSSEGAGGRFSTAGAGNEPAVSTVS